MQNSIYRGEFLRFFSQNVLRKSRRECANLWLTHSLLKCLVLEDYEILICLEDVKCLVDISNAIYFPCFVWIICDFSSLHSSVVIENFNRGAVSVTGSTI